MRRERVDRTRRGEACGVAWFVTAVAVEMVLISILRALRYRGASTVSLSFFFVIG